MKLPGSRDGDPTCVTMAAGSVPSVVVPLDDGAREVRVREVVVLELAELVVHAHVPGFVQHVVQALVAVVRDRLLHRQQGTRVTDGHVLLKKLIMF